MTTQQINFLIGALGLVILLGGIVFEAMDNALVAIPLTGVGASVLATAIVNWVLNRRADNNLVLSILDALSERSQFIRKDHELDLTFSLKGNEVLLQKVHQYHLYNQTSLERTRKVSMFTDSISWQHTSNADGFVWIEEPSGTRLEGDSLKQKLDRESGKVCFRKEYKFPSKTSIPFKFYSTSLFRKKDRLIWTVQDFSDRFRVRIVNRTGVCDCIMVKINHHNEEVIKNNIFVNKLVDGSEEIRFDFPTVILPYQGFEVMWDLNAMEPDGEKA